VIANRVVGNAPSGTVLSLLRTRAHAVNASLPYLGVAAWTQTTDTRPWVVRSVAGPQRSLLLPLPESKKEVETIADLLPKPSTVLLGSEATKRHFESLPLDEYEVLHLALHGYADTEFPDRSALVFAPPSRATNDDGLLQAREIRRLHLNARLVTLSACDTGVGPVSEAGVANLSAAFIQAGAQSVVSTLWELEDTSTNRLMKAFYDHLSRREGEAESLREAKLSLFRAGFKPSYWASFEIVGDSSGGLFLAGNEAGRVVGWGRRR
jgi:CHAT domain-containing protein